MQHERQQQLEKQRLSHTREKVSWRHTGMAQPQPAAAAAAAAARAASAGRQGALTMPPPQQIMLGALQHLAQKHNTPNRTTWLRMDVPQPPQMTKPASNIAMEPAEAAASAAPAAADKAKALLMALQHRHLHQELQHQVYPNGASPVCRDHRRCQAAIKHSSRSSVSYKQML